MNSRIRQLPALISNQIAAGEVVERPASVVKELLENALDAGATAISIDIGAGGLNLIKVSDNGCGIDPEDLPLAIAAHATSKISQLSDLYEITSMGFRGEALASIASVSKLSICSRPITETHATLLSIENTRAHLSPCARSLGTTIEVRDLFFNAPVRKNFLKSERQEYLAIEALVKRFALSAPAIVLTLKHNDKPLLVIPAATCERTRLARIKKIMGKSFVEGSVYLDVERAGIAIEGFLSLPTYMRSQSDKQLIYVNHRMVKDKLLNHALKQVYNERLYPGRHPACLLYVTMPPKDVDVNVHPTKHEVRFKEPRLVHDFMTSQLSEALSTADPIRIVDTDISKPSNLQLHHSSIKREWSIPAHVQSTNDSDWILLNHQFAILKLNELNYIVDMGKLKQLRMRAMISQLSLPWASRPLLIPMKYASDKSNLVKMKQCLPLLATLGMEIELISDGQYQLKTIPLLLQSLDIQAFFNALSVYLQQDSYDQSALIDMMIDNQTIDAINLQSDERILLKEFAEKSILREPNTHDWFRLFDIDACRRFLHV